MIAHTSADSWGGVQDPVWARQVGCHKHDNDVACAVCIQTPVFAPDHSAIVPFAGSEGSSSMSFERHSHCDTKWESL